MPRYNAYDYNQLVMVPVSLEQQLEPGTLECAIHDLIEERLDTSIFDDRYTALSYKAPKRACRDFTLRSKCLRHPHTPVRQVRLFSNKRPGSITDAMRAKIDTPQGRRIYGKRLAHVEPVFANLREQKRMDRFTVRGRHKVNIQWRLYCLVHNIEKIANYGEMYAKAS